MPGSVRGMLQHLPARLLVAGVPPLGRRSPPASLAYPPTLAPSPSLPPSRQGYYACDASVKVGHPKSVEDVAALVRQFPKVKARPGAGGGG